MFLESNSQLIQIAFHWSASNNYLRATIPLLSQFHSLQTLFLVWEENDTPPSSLDTLVLLPAQLEKLHLSAGLQHSWSWQSYDEDDQLDWFANHNHIRRRIARLQKLKELAFTSDIYTYTGPISGTEMIPESYEELRVDHRVWS